MTLYWWTHWFWITVFSIFHLLDSTHFVGTYPLNSPYGNKDYSKDEPLTFPLAAQTDVDDVFSTDEMILSSIFRNSKVIRQKDTLQKTSSSSSAKIKDNIVMPPLPPPSALGEAQPQQQMKSKNYTASTGVDDKINRTKAVDVNLVNSSNSSLSTHSSIEVTLFEADGGTDSPEHLPNPVNTNDIADNSNPFLKSFHFENITKEEEIIRAEIARQLDGERARKSKVLAEYRQELKFNFSADSKNLLARSAAISLDDFHQEQDEGNISSEALSIQRAYILDAGAISGICFAVVGLFSGVALAGIVLYRRRYLNKPQALSEPDSSGYIDDSTIRDNSDEMYSLDNDSFLNSLEAMTIQNYWTDTVKHTKL
ncbi:unnamed protein product [Hermetia illucens]|uniref:Uncharacterized protein n=1 Tax=Hermetia illucens TaxID=343691 RepID=A0A7R8UZH3_HERIL|nr:unnamed protein product [Hermetia illucens]